jgi:hypothetical protein
MAQETQELQRMAEDLRNAFQGLDESTKNANVGLKAFAKEIKTVPGQLAKGLTGAALAAAKGEANLKSFNSVIDVAVTAVGAVAKIVPYFGDAITAAAKAVGDGAKVVVEQIDATAKTFNAISASGAAAADGMTGLQRQFTAAGLNMQQFQKIVSQNAVALARFRGTAGDGAEELSKVAKDLKYSDLRKIGMSAEDISNTTAAFVSQQTRLGRSQTMSTEQLTAGAKNYALELDLLSKVTGLSREAIQKQQDAALSEARFRAKYDEEMQSGDPARIKAAEEMLKLQTRLSTFGKGELGQAVRDLYASGAAVTDAAVSMTVGTGGQAMAIIQKMETQALTADEAQQELTGSYKENAKWQRANAKVLGDSNVATAQYVAQSDLMNSMQEGSFEKAKKTQATQISNTDKLTQEVINAQIELEKFNVKMSVIAMDLMPAAAGAIGEMTKAMNALVDWASEEFGATTPGAKERKAEAARANSAGGAKGTSAGGGATVVGGGGGEGDAGAIMEAQAAGRGTAGLKLKSAEATAGGESSEGLIALAYALQEKLGGDLKYFSGLNDTGRDKDSKHKTGKAIDLVLNDPDKYSSVLAMVKSMPGVSFAQYEEKGQRNSNGSIATGTHIHAEVSAANGAILSGPTSGYQPNLTMHGTEAIVPLNSPAAQSMGMGGGENTSLMAAQLEKLEEMVSVMKNQLSVSTKIMQYAS